MNTFNINDITFDGWHVDEVGESVVLFFMAPKSYLDYPIPYTGEYRDSAVGAKISLEIPIDTDNSRFNAASSKISIDIDSVSIGISPIIEADNGLVDTIWCIVLPADDIRQLITLANEQLGCLCYE